MKNLRTTYQQKYQIQVVRMIMVILVSVSMAQFRTSTNTCTTEKSIFKLDVRQKVQNLPPNSTVKDIDASALCQEAYMYDYIWLQQLWIPGGYNFKNVNGEPQKTSDEYRELLSIKEYLIDPSLGQLTDLYMLQSNIRVNCPHIKFLGEFSFYVSKDSYLLQNVTRFLRRPPTDNYHIYNYRYDKDDLAWAVNDQMKTIPYAVPWNYFDPIVLNDMKDIIYRLIIDQHKLDGIVFLYPGLGLYSVMNDIYEAEVSFYGVTQYLQDFYQSLGLKQNSQTLFFMGGEDNLNTKIFLQNYLQQVYGNPISKVWANMNYTFTIGTYSDSVDDKTVKGNDVNNLGYANLQLQPSNPTCIAFQIINQGRIEVGFYNYLNSRYTLVYNGSFRYNGDPFLDDSYCFTFSEQDIIEIQYDQSIEQFIFKKYSIDYTNLQQLSMMIPGGYNNLQPLVNIQKPGQVQIKFPFQFSQTNKNIVLVIQNSQQIAMTTSLNQNSYYYAQIWPSINQNENSVTLNFKVTSLQWGVTVGVCNQDIVNKNNNQKLASSQLGTGVYQWMKDGYFWHHSSTSFNNAGNGKQFGLGDVISVTYTRSNSSIQFYKNSIYQLTLPIIDKIKNLNFCAGLETSLTVVQLVY